MPLDRIVVEGGVKDVAGHLIPGRTKTGEPRYPILWTPIAEEVVELYEAQGRPPLDSLVLPNIHGAYRRFDNWRDRNWYRALHAAGLSAAPEATARGAFDPIVLRHTCATVMFHAVKPNSIRGHYTSKEIANQPARRRGRRVPATEIDRRIQWVSVIAARRES